MSVAERAEDGRAARLLLREVAAGARSLEHALQVAPVVASAYDRLVSYADRLLLVLASGAHTDLEELRGMVDQHQPAVLVVDYLQKVPVAALDLSELEQITRVTQGLKELAMDGDLAVVAVAAADRDGLHAPRLRLRHLRGSSRWPTRPMWWWS
ncbi:MAG: hypothetical protein ACRDVM_09540 [Acidimicrobiia bacterium]